MPRLPSARALSFARSRLWTACRPCQGRGSDWATSCVWFPRCRMEGNPLADGEAAQAQKVFADAASTVQEGGGKELQETADALKGMSISVDAQGKNDDAGVIDTRAKEIEAQASCWAAGHERRVLPTPGPQGIDDSAWLAAVRPRSGYSRCSEGGEPWAIRVPSARDTGMGLRPVRPPSACRSRDGSETVPDVHRARDVRRSESGIELPPVKRPSAAFTTDAKAGLRSEPSGGNQGKKLPTSHKPLQKRMTEDADRLRIPRKPGLDTGLFKSTEATRQIPRLKGTAGKPRAHRSLSDTGGSDPRDPADLGKALKPTRIADHIRAVDPVLGANIHPAERIRRKIHRSCDLAQLQPRLLPIGQPRAGAP